MKTTLARSNRVICRNRLGIHRSSSKALSRYILAEWHGIDRGFRQSPFNVGAFVEGCIFTLHVLGVSERVSLDANWTKSVRVSLIPPSSMDSIRLTIGGWLFQVNVLAHPVRDCPPPLAEKVYRNSRRPTTVTLEPSRIEIQAT